MSIAALTTEAAQRASILRAAGRGIDLSCADGTGYFIERAPHARNRSVCRSQIERRAGIQAGIEY